MRILDRITESKILWRLKALLPKLEKLVKKDEEGVSLVYRVGDNENVKNNNKKVFDFQKSMQPNYYKSPIIHYYDDDDGANYFMQAVCDTSQFPEFARFIVLGWNNDKQLVPLVVIVDSTGTCTISQPIVDEEEYKYASDYLPIVENINDN